MIAAAFVRGLQGKHERYIRAGATCKHFAAHSGPEHNPVSRLQFDAKVTNFIACKMRTYFLKDTADFKMVIEE